MVLPFYFSVPLFFLRIKWIFVFAFLIIISAIGDTNAVASMRRPDHHVNSLNITNGRDFGRTLNKEAVNTNSDLKDEVISLVYFHRHGDRSPCNFLPLDTVNNAKWPDGLGQLTEMGKHQLISLGKEFRNRYLLGEPYRVLDNGEYHPHKVVVRSTDYDRTIQSALSLLSGMFPNTAASSDPNNFQQPQIIPVRTMPQKLDFVLDSDMKVCDRLRELQKSAQNSEEWVATEKANQDLWPKLEAASGLTSVNYSNVRIIGDPLICEQQHKMPWLDAFVKDPSLFSRVIKLRGEQLRPLYAGSEEMRRLSGGNMLGQVIGRFQRFTGVEQTVPSRPKGEPVLKDGSDLSDVRISHFSAHDSTLAALLGSLDVLGNENPPYASSIVFELVRSQKKLFVRVFYNKGSESLFSKPLNLCNETTENSGHGDGICTLSEFVEKYQRIVSEDYTQECKRSNSPEKNVLLSAGFLVPVVLLASVLVYFCYHQSRERYSRVEDQNYF